MCDNFKSLSSQVHMSMDAVSLNQFMEEQEVAIANGFM